MTAERTMHARAFAEARPVPYWLDRDDRPEPLPPLAGERRCDLAVVGGGFTGLWAAIQAKERDPGRDVALLEADAVAAGGSGRNGGFVEASLTHGLERGLARFGDEIELLERLAAENLAGLESALERYGIGCDYERVGALAVAREPHQEGWLVDHAAGLRRFGYDVSYLSGDEVRAQLDSPTYRAAVWQRDRCAIVDPARLAWGLRAAALELGVEIHEASAVRRLRGTAAGVELHTDGGRLTAPRTVLATNGFPPLVRAIRRYVVPIYDYVLVSEPLSAARRDAIGWRNRQGVTDIANQFNYYRLTADDRILWGGYDAIYHFRNGVGPHLEQRYETFDALSRNLFTTFPQLEGLRFTHRWSGVIDTCSRFCVMFGTAFDGRVAYAVGYTGLGVAATRFGGDVALDLLDGADTEATRSAFVRTKAVPFPPEPLRWLGIQLTRSALARADRNQGRRGLWLRALDRVGLGQDS